MKTILAPTDFSENATNALNYAASLAKQAKAKIILVHIVNVNLPILPLDNNGVLAPLVNLEINYQRELNKIANQLQEQGAYQIEVEAICQFGFFLTDLYNLVKAKNVDLVVMGTKGASNFLEKIMGTNTYDFIKIAPCPVLALPAKTIFTGIHAITYASDFEIEETVFLKQLLQFAQPFAPVISIINIKSEEQLCVVPDDIILKEIQKEFPDNKFCIAQMQEDDVEGGIRQFIAENRTDVLAISIQSRFFIERLLHHSVTRKLAFAGSIPLLTLPQHPYKLIDLSKSNKPASVSSL